MSMNVFLGGSLTSLIVTADILRGAAVLLLVVAFMPGVIAAWTFRRPRE